jgi:hypothetical protein
LKSSKKGPANDQGAVHTKRANDEKNNALGKYI